jgi:homoserine kinase
VTGPPPAQVRVLAPATSANLGPGFDALGLALGIHDDVRLAVRDGGVEVEVTGEGSTRLRRDDRHLVAKAAQATFAALGADVPGIRLTCANAVPHGRGMGSSAAAICAGVVAAGALAARYGGRSLDPVTALELAARLEGHPDNVAACLLGGFTIAWCGPQGPRAVRLEPVSGLEPVVFLPRARASTARSRRALPAHVPHRDAAHSAGRAALLVAALTARPEELLAATEDHLHQPYRLPGLPRSAELVARLRAAGVAAVLSGSGPAVLAICAFGRQAAAAVELAGPRWRSLQPGLDRDGARVVEYGP